MCQGGGLRGRQLAGVLLLGLHRAAPPRRTAASRSPCRPPPRRAAMCCSQSGKHRPALSHKSKCTPPTARPPPPPSPPPPSRQGPPLPLPRRAHGRAGLWRGLPGRGVGAPGRLQVRLPAGLCGGLGLCPRRARAVRQGGGGWVGGCWALLPRAPGRGVGPATCHSRARTLPPLPPAHARTHALLPAHPLCATAGLCARARLGAGVPGAQL